MLFRSAVGNCPSRNISWATILCTVALAYESVGLVLPRMSGCTSINRADNFMIRFRDECLLRIARRKYSTMYSPVGRTFTQGMWTNGPVITPNAPSQCLSFLHLSLSCTYINHCKEITITDCAICKASCIPKSRASKYNVRSICI